MPLSLTEPASTALAASTAAFGIAALVVGGLLASGLARYVLDRPNERSMHTTPIPRLGGVGVLAGFVTAMLIWRTPLPWALWAGLATIATVSALDDRLGLHAVHRLPLHLAGAGIAAAGILAGHGWPALALATVALAWMVNLYNFMDGSDALAGSMGVFGFGTYAVAAAIQGDAPIAIAAAAAAGSAGGFLAFNLPPARIFMGDLGSTSLGFLAGAIGLLGVARDLWSPLLPAMAFMPFVFDASATLADRALRGRRVWEAHREHAYQKLNLGGFGHRRTALTYAALMAASSAAALASLVDDLRIPAFGALLALHAALWLAVRRAWRRREALAARRP
jgi:UDP-GlcNAc:undecaprenyl-phosphate GlcNAc-1-phosphate transferase